MRSKKKKFSFLSLKLALRCGLTILLCGCEFLYVPLNEPFYEPAFYGDTAGCPGTKAHQWFVYNEEVDVPYTAEDLKKTMSLGKLLDIALYNNPTTRASWNAARAAAFGYH